MKINFVGLMKAYSGLFFISNALYPTSIYLTQNKGTADLATTTKIRSVSKRG